MQYLPEFVGSLFSLQHFVLIGCKNLAHAPKMDAISVTSTNRSVNPFIIAPRKDVLRASTLNSPKTEWITEEKFTYI